MFEHFTEGRKQLSVLVEEKTYILVKTISLLIKLIKIYNNIHPCSGVITTQLTSYEVSI